MPDLYSGSRQIHTVFDLLGRSEDDLTHALGWGLTHSPQLVNAVMGLIGLDKAGHLTDVRLQQTQSGLGRTDVELLFPETLVIIEAKVGWDLPRPGQLEQYAKHTFPKNTVPALVVLSEATEDYARRKVGGIPKEIDGIPVKYIQWNRLISDAESSIGSTNSHKEKRLLQELTEYLRSVVKPTDPYSAKTYCVALGGVLGEGWKRTTRQIVLEDRKYTHPYAAGGWPKLPPNYLAFRWDGRVQIIHHVEDCQLVDDPSDFIKDAPAHNSEHGYLAYSLGPKIGPSKPLPAGKNYRDSRLWVALDLLLTASTLEEAHSLTKERWPV